MGKRTKKKSQMKAPQGTAHVHDKHIDVVIPLSAVPFDVQLGQKLVCGVKGCQRLGIKTDGNLHLFITTRKNPEFINMIKKEIVDQAVKERQNELNRRINELQRIKTIYEKCVVSLKKGDLFDSKLDEAERKLVEEI